jgi:sugar phosphate isomerase/epimerase
MPHSLTRRQLLGNATRATALGAFGLLSPSHVATAAKPIATSVLKIGVATLGFPKVTHAALATELSGAGIRLVQLFLAQSDTPFWNYNGRADVSGLTPARCREIASVYRDAGIAIHSLGVYTNLIHPDAMERQANLDHFAAMMDIGGHLGVHTFITEAGHHRDPAGPEPRIAHHFQDTVWPQMIATARQLATLAEQRGATVLFEAFYRGFLASARRLRLFLDEAGSPRLRALLDPANLIEVNDLDEMFQQLGPRIDCLHAKDRTLHVERGVAAGRGSLDYVKFVTLAAQLTPAAPLILEYVGPSDYRAALANLRAVLQQAGVPAV